MEIADPALHDGDMERDGADRDQAVGGVKAKKGVDRRSTPFFFGYYRFFFLSLSRLGLADCWAPCPEAVVSAGAAGAAGPAKLDRDNTLLLLAAGVCGPADRKEIG